MIEGFKTLDELRRMIALLKLEDKEAIVPMKNETFHKYLDMTPAAKRDYYNGNKVKVFGMEVKIV